MGGGRSLSDGSRQSRRMEMLVPVGLLLTDLIQTSVITAAIATMLKVIPVFEFINIHYR